MLASHGTPVKAGTTDVSVILRVIDSADGTPETGVDHATSGIDLKYWREGGTATDITEAALAALSTAHTDGGVEQIGAGYIRVDLPDAACASGATAVHVFGNVTGMVVIGATIPLIAYDPMDTVRLGLTSLPNAAAAASGGLFTRGTGAGQINQDANGRIDVNIAAISTDSGAADTLESYCDGTTPQPVNVTQLSGDSTAADNAEAFFDGTGYAGTNNVIPTVTAVTTVNGLAANSITAAAAAADFGTEVGTAVWASATRVLTAGTNIALAKGTGVTGFNDLSAAQVNAEVDTAISDAALATAANLAAVAGYLDTEIAAILADTNELQTDWANGGRLDLILDARASQSSVDTIDGIVDDILTDTAVIGAAGAGLTALPWNAAWDAQVESEVTDALNTYDPPTNTEMNARTLATADYATAAALATVDGIADSLLVIANKMDDTLEDDGGTFRFTTNALEQAPSGGGGLTVQDIVDGVWDEPITDHLDSGSTGAALNAAGSAGDPWSTPLPGAYGSGTAGKIVGDNINATISSRATQTSVDTIDGIVDSILVDTAEIGAAGAGLTALATAAALATVDTVVDAILVDTAEIGAAGAGLSAVPWNAAWDAEVQSEVTDALNAYDPPTRAELTTDTNSILAAVGDVPTNAELATALASADDATLAAIAALSIPTATQNADALLNRDMSAVSDTNARSPLNALRFIRNKWTITTGTLSVKKEDDATEAWNAAVSTTPGADPVTGNDPA